MEKKVIKARDACCPLQTAWISQRQHGERRWYYILANQEVQSRAECCPQVCTGWQKIGGMERICIPQAKNKRGKKKKFSYRKVDSWKLHNDGDSTKDRKGEGKRIKEKSIKDGGGNGNKSLPPPQVRCATAYHREKQSYFPTILAPCNCISSSFSIPESFS